MRLLSKLLSKLLTTVSVPAVLGAALLYAATHADGDASWLYVIASWGVIMAMVGVAFGRITYNTHRIRLLEEQNAGLNDRLRDIENNQNQIRAEVDSYLAVKEWRQAGMTGTEFARNHGFRVISGGAEEN